MREKNQKKRREGIKIVKATKETEEKKIGYKDNEGDKRDRRQEERV